MDNLRWLAVIRYRDGTSEEHRFDELCSLHDIVEHGQNFDKIAVIEITYARLTYTQRVQESLKHGGDNAKNGA